MGNRLEERRGDDVTTYRRDALGHVRTIERVADGQESSVEFEFDPVGELTAIDGQPVDWPSTVYGRPFSVGGATTIEAAGSPVATVDGGELRWMSCDWRGDVGEGYGPWGSQPSAAPQLDEAASLGYLGELGVGPLVWLRRRLFDSSIHAFLERDPLFGPSGVPGEFTYPYQYAANNPLSWVDPVRAQTDFDVRLSETWLKRRPMGTGLSASWSLPAWLWWRRLGERPFRSCFRPILPAIAIGGVAGAVGTAISEKVSGQPFDPLPAILMGGAVGAVVGAVVGTGGVVALTAGASDAGAAVFAGGVGIVAGGTSLSSQPARFGRQDRQSTDGC